MKLSVDKQKKLISDDDVHAAFLRREDIASLSSSEQEKRWQKHLVGVNRFRDLMSGLDAVVVDDYRRKSANQTTT